MTDQAAADGKDPPPGDIESDGDENEESWLRRAIGASSGGGDAALPMIGDVVDGKYKIEAQIGRGGMGAVFRARHALSEKAVALKWMLSPASDDQARRRFAREARAVGRIDHPNVVALYDVHQEGERAYLVMELLRGESLRSRLARGALDAHTAVDLLLPAMHGVAAAHAVGVIHRDLKPDNIFLCEGPDGSPREAKVLDFGVSSMAAAETGDSTLTKVGSVLGSPAYMSPEQLRDPHDVDNQTDVYALGVILYEALAGVRPFPAQNLGALIFSIDTGSPKPLSQRRTDLPDGLEPIVLRAFARDRAQRYPTMQSLIDALRSYGTDSK